MKTTVLLGDPRLPDPVKKDGQFNPEDLETISNLKSTLSLLKQFDFHYLDDHKIFFQNLINNKPDFVFNLCDEGFNNQATKELHVPALLELLDIPYTGAGPSCLATCYNKSTIRLIANHMNIPVPTEYYLAPTDLILPTPSSYPVLIKPNFGDGSFGITRNSVIQNHEEYIKQIQVMREQFPHTPLLIQEFLTGSEYSVGIIGNPGNFEVLPLIEIDFSALPEDFPKILSYESKWLSESPYWKKVVFKEATSF